MMSLTDLMMFLQTPPGWCDPADAEPAAIPGEEVPRWARLPRRRQASLQEPVGEAARKLLLLRRRRLLQDGPPAQSLGESHHSMSGEGWRFNVGDVPPVVTHCWLIGRGPPLKSRQVGEKGTASCSLTDVPSGPPYGSGSAPIQPGLRGQQVRGSLKEQRNHDVGVL